MNNRFRSLIAAAAITAATLSGSFVRADDTKLSPAFPQVEALATLMKDVGKAVEPSVVSIIAEKSAVASNQRGNLNPRQRDLQDEMLRRLFPDTDGDGEPDVPDNLQFRMPNIPQRSVGEGSGVILDATTDKAYILTNNHVAGGASKILVTLHDGRRIEDVTVVGVDPATDLAVLEIKADGLQAVRWGNSETLEKGDIVLAFGSPFGYVGSMTQGIVSGTNRTTAPHGGPGLLGQGGYEYFIQTDCAINPGNSGGPLINTRGEVVGINTAIASTTGSFNGIGFAVPSSLAKFVYDQIKDEGKVTRGFLGVLIRDASSLPTAQATSLKLSDRRGVFVERTSNDTPAAGKLEPSDVILSIDDKPVSNMAELRLKVASTTPGTELTFGVLRDGKERPVKIKIGKLPDDSQVATGQRQDRVDSSNAETGIGLATPNANRLRGANLPADATGALVTEVKAGSPAEIAGLEVNDLITKINGKDVKNADEAKAALKEVNIKDGISLRVLTADGSKSVFIQSE